MKILLIEDEDDAIARFSKAANARGIELDSGKAELGRSFDGDDPLEHQLSARLREMQEKSNFDIVLLDTNLSKIHNGLSASACRQALYDLGIAVCRYSKRQTAGQSTRYSELRRLAVEGASAIGVSSGLLDDPQDKLLPWMIEVQRGFANLFDALKKIDYSTVGKLGPAGTLAKILERPSLTSDLLGYTSQTLQFFGSSLTDPSSANDASELRVSVSLGYWLFNSILAFPGPILNLRATAAFLNLRLDSIKDHKALLDAISPAKYSGPFASVEAYFWREELEKLLDVNGGDILQARQLKGMEIARVDTGNSLAQGYLCVISNTEVTEAEAGPNPDWIPVGAQVARIRREIFEQLDPMLSA